MGDGSECAQGVSPTPTFLLTTRRSPSAQAWAEVTDTRLERTDSPHPRWGGGWGDPMRRLGPHQRRVGQEALPPPTPAPVPPSPPATGLLDGFPSLAALFPRLCAALALGAGTGTHWPLTTASLPNHPKRSRKTSQLQAHPAPETSPRAADPRRPQGRQGGAITISWASVLTCGGRGVLGPGRELGLEAGLGVRVLLWKVCRDFCCKRPPENLRPPRSRLRLSGATDSTGGRLQPHRCHLPPSASSPSSRV